MSIGIWQLILCALIVLPIVFTICGSWSGVRRAGYNGAWALVLLVPIVNLIILWIFAFVTWPIERETPVDADAHRT